METDIKELKILISEVNRKIVNIKSKKLIVHIKQIPTSTITISIYKKL